MKTAIALLIAALSAPLFAADATPARNPFPDDYTPAACANLATCPSYSQDEAVSAAHTFLGFDLDVKWLAANWDKLQAAVAPVCRKQATCIATPGNPRVFCNDLIAPMLRATCDSTFGASSGDKRRCLEFVEVFALGMDQMSPRPAREVEKCAGERTQHTKPPIVWMSPATLPAGWTDYVTFYALDPDTHVPVQATVTFEQQKHYAPSNPTGEATTYYPFKLPFKYAEVPNAQGHRDLVAPMVTVAAEGYPPVQFRLPTPQPKLVVSMTPSIAKLKRGGKATITAKDATTGEPVELRVFLGETQLGDTNQTIVVDWPKNKKRPELWARSLFNRYGDVVVAPAAK